MGVSGFLYEGNPPQFRVEGSTKRVKRAKMNDVWREWSGVERRRGMKEGAKWKERKEGVSLNDGGRKGREGTEEVA